MSESICSLATVSRRSVLGALAGAAALTTMPLCGVAGTAQRVRAEGADIHQTLRLRYRATLVGPPDLDVDDPAVAQESAALADRVRELYPLLDRSANRQAVFTDNPLVGATDASAVTNTVKHLVDMAEAWGTPGNDFSGDAELATDVIAGMRTLNELQYYAGHAEWDNWWDWEIGSAYRLGQIIVIMYDVFPADLRQQYVDAVAWYVDPGIMYPNDPNKRKPATGSNLQKINLGAAIMAIVGRQDEVLAEVQRTTPLGMGYHTDSDPTPDGLYPDGSFLQHNTVAYNGAYGVEYISTVAGLVALLGGSPWEINSDGMQEVLDGVDAGYLPVLYDGILMDFVAGRDVSWSSRSDAERGRGLAMTIIQLAYGAGPDRRARWLAAASGWIHRSSVIDLSRPTSIASVQRIRDALAVAPAPEPAEVSTFPVMDRAVHRRPGWAVTLSASSTRIARFEVTNYENLRPWHQGSGQLATYYSGDTTGQHTDGYWPTVDPYRLPGTTVDSVPFPTVDQKTLRPTGYGRTAFSTVGGPLDDKGRQRGAYGAAFSEEQGYQSTMRVNQSWFFIDEGVVCLGAGIDGGDQAVETIVENRRVPLDSRLRWTVDATELAASAGPGFRTAVTQPGWAALEGVAGYLFLERPRTLRLLREDRTGAWADIKRGDDPTPMTRGYTTAWIDHGTDPQQATYGYLFAPAATVDQTRDLAAVQPVTLVANTVAVQAIRVASAGFVGANFTVASGIKAGPHWVQVDASCSLSSLVGHANTRMEVAVADMNRDAERIRASITLPTRNPGWRITFADPSVTAAIDGETLVIDVVPGGGGDAHRVVVEV